MFICKARIPHGSHFPREEIGASRVPMTPHTMQWWWRTRRLRGPALSVFAMVGMVTESANRAQRAAPDAPPSMHRTGTRNPNPVWLHRVIYPPRSRGGVLFAPGGGGWAGGAGGPGWARPP